MNIVAFIAEHPVETLVSSAVAILTVAVVAWPHKRADNGAHRAEVDEWIDPDVTCYLERHEPPAEPTVAIYVNVESAT